MARADAPAPQLQRARLTRKAVAALVVIVALLLTAAAFVPRLRTACLALVGAVVLLVVRDHFVPLPPGAAGGMPLGRGARTLLSLATGRARAAPRHKVE